MATGSFSSFKVLYEDEVSFFLLIRHAMREITSSIKNIKKTPPNPVQAAS